MENHNSTKSLYYNYPIKKLLTKNFDLLNNINEYSQIILCTYLINTDGKYPFLQYLLSNNFNELNLPILQKFDLLNKDNLISYSTVFLSSLFNIENFNEFNNVIECDGYYEFGENLYLFFDVSNYTKNIENLHTSFLNLFCLTDEIINHQKACNMLINEDTINFFITNNSINYLYDENNTAFEHPIVAFVGKPTPEKLEFTYIFGECPKDKMEIFGSYYYFTDFNYAIRQAGWSHNYNDEHMHDKVITYGKNGKRLKSGIVRFALFMGKTKYIENMPNSPIDNSVIKKERLNDVTFNKKQEIQTMRISDHDGLWATVYDSVHLANIELDDGTYIEQTPIIVLKDYCQQTPLSFHYIDKHTLGEKYDPNYYGYKIV